jgi:hypothetical protein
MTTNPDANATMLPMCAVAAALVFAGAACLLTLRPAAATTTYAAATGQPCAACHVQPDGGPDLTAFGKAFQANGNKLPQP